MQSQLNKSANTMLKIGQDIPEWYHAQKLKEITVKVRMRNEGLK
jgi:hypothetical protein